MTRDDEYSTAAQREAKVRARAGLTALIASTTSKTENMPNTSEHDDDLKKTYGISNGEKGK